MRVFLLSALSVFTLSCGVKKDPEPPLTPTEIGRGQPLFKVDTDKSSPASIKKGSSSEPEKDDETSDED